MAEIGKRLRIMRKCRHITQEKLAEAVSVSPRQLANIEAGKRGLTLRNAISIADYFGLSLDYVYRARSVSGSMDPICQLVGDTLMHIQDIRDRDFYISQIISLSQYMGKAEVEAEFEKVLETL